MLFNKKNPHSLLNYTGFFRQLFLLSTHGAGELLSSLYIRFFRADPLSGEFNVKYNGEDIAAMASSSSSSSSSPHAPGVTSACTVFCCFFALLNLADLCRARLLDIFCLRQLHDVITGFVFSGSAFRFGYSKMQ